MLVVLIYQVGGPYMTIVFLMTLSAAHLYNIKASVYDTAPVVMS
jgi:hypothetical protein